LIDRIPNPKNNLMLRLDTILETGVFDAEFFASDEYTACYRIAKRYLEDEGFENFEKEFVIQITEHWWHVRKLACEMLFPWSK
jgi:hypothetical protein